VTQAGSPQQGPWGQGQQPQGGYYPPPPPPRGSRGTRTLIIAIAGSVVIVAAVVVVVVIARGGSDDGGSGGAAAAARQFAKDLTSMDDDAVRSDACSDARDDVAQAASNLGADVMSVTVTGDPAVSGDTAKAPISVKAGAVYELPNGPGVPPSTHSATPTFPGTVTLRSQGGDWCVSDLQAQPPVY
jgi:hypothetical protein